MAENLRPQEEADDSGIVTFSEVILEPLESCDSVESSGPSYGSLPSGGGEVVVSESFNAQVGERHEGTRILSPEEVATNEQQGKARAELLERGFLTEIQQLPDTLFMDRVVQFDGVQFLKSKSDQSSSWVIVHRNKKSGVLAKPLQPGKSIEFWDGGGWPFKPLKFLVFQKTGQSEVYFVQGLATNGKEHVYQLGFSPLVRLASNQTPFQMVAQPPAVSDAVPSPEQGPSFVERLRDRINSVVYAGHPSLIDMKLRDFAWPPQDSIDNLNCNVLMPNGCFVVYDSDAVKPYNPFRNSSTHGIPPTRVCVVHGMYKPGQNLPQVSPIQKGGALEFRAGDVSLTDPSFKTGRIVNVQPLKPHFISVPVYRVVLENGDWYYFVQVPAVNASGRRIQSA